MDEEKEDFWTGSIRRRFCIVFGVRTILMSCICTSVGVGRLGLNLHMNMIDGASMIHRM